MRALILAAGLGTRLRPLTSVRAKAAVPVNGRPLIARVISWLVSEGLDDLVVNLHHHPASITRLVGEGRELGARVRYSWEQPVLGSAGGPRRALPLLVDVPSGDGSFLMVNGDTLTSLSLTRFAAAHRDSGALVTMALIENPRPDVYGGVRVEDGWVARFHQSGLRRTELPLHRRAGGPGARVPGPRGRRASRIGDGPVPASHTRERPVDTRIRRRRAVQRHRHPGRLLAKRAAARRRGRRSLVGNQGISIDPTATLERTAVWDDVTIGKNCTLEECIVCDGVNVPAGSSYRCTALVPYSGQPVRQDERVEGALLLRAF